MLSQTKLRARLPGLLLLVSVLLSGVPLAAEPVKLTFTGDLIGHLLVQNAPHPDRAYQALAPWLKTDDWSFVNLETPVDATRVQSAYPKFNAHPPFAAAAVRGGFDVFSLANNHANDFGFSSAKGTLTTMAGLGTTTQGQPVRWSGLTAPGETDAVVRLDTKGITIGYVALTNLLNQPWEASRVNAIAVWDIWKRKAFPDAQKALLERVQGWKAQVDVLIVSLHDGVEYSTVPDPLQVAFDRELVRAGVDILWGHHPHVLQSAEWVQTARGPRLLLFSLGNLLSHQTAQLTPADAKSPTARRGDGVLLRVEVDRKTDNGSADTGTGTGTIQITRVEPVWVNNYLDPQGNVTVVPTETLVREAPGAWKEYYRQRLDVQRALAMP